MSVNQTIADNAPPARLKFDKPALSKQAREAVGEIVKGFEDCEAALEECNLYSDKSATARVLQGWARRKHSIQEAVLSAFFRVGDKKELISELKAGAKEELRNMSLAGAKFVQPVVAARAADADKRADELESRERKEAEKLGVVYVASPTVASIRQTARQLHHRSEALSGPRASVQKGELVGLL